MVWKMYFLSKMAILGSYVRFLGCNSSQNVSILKFFFDIRCHSVPHEKCRQGLVVQKAEALTDDAEKAVRGSNLDHWISPQKSVKTPLGTANRSLNLLPILGANQRNDGCKIYGTILRDFDSWKITPCIVWVGNRPLGSHLKNTIQNRKLAGLVASGLMMDRWIG